MKVTIRKFSEEELAEQAFMAKLNSKTFDLWTIEEREQFIAVLETKPVPYGDCTSDGRFVSILESIPRSDWTEKQTKRYRKVKESKFDKYVDDSRYKEVLEQTPLAEWTGTEKSHYLTMVKREKDKKAIVQEEERRNREVERLLAQKQGHANPISDDADSPPIILQDKPAEVKVINDTIDYNKLENAVFNAAYRAQTRFQEPLDEVEIEKVHRLRQEGKAWKDIAKIISPDISKDDLASEADRIRQQHKREYPDSYPAKK